MGNLNEFIFTFGIARRCEGEACVLVDMDYVASDELGNLVRLGFVLDVEFTYVVRSVQHKYYHTSKHVQRTLDDVPNSWASIFCEDGMANGNLTESCHQVVRFVGRFFIELVDLHVFVIVVRAALDPSLRKINVLQ